MPNMSSVLVQIIQFWTNLSKKYYARILDFASPGKIKYYKYIQMLKKDHAGF